MKTFRTFHYEMAMTGTWLCSIVGLLGITLGALCFVGIEKINGEFFAIEVLKYMVVVPIIIVSALAVIYVSILTAWRFSPKWRNKLYRHVENARTYIMEMASPEDRRNSIAYANGDKKHITAVCKISSGIYEWKPELSGYMLWQSIYFSLEQIALEEKMYPKEHGK